MKDEIIKVLKDVYDAKEAIQVNDLLGLKTTEEYKEVVKNLEELVEEYVLYKTKKDKYI